MKEVVLRVQNLEKRFHISKKQQKLENTKEKVKTAVVGVSFEAYKGEIFGLLGPNGAGKTTTLRMIATLLKPDAGDVLVDGSSILTHPEQVREKIGFLTSELKLEEFFTPNYLFRFFSDLHNIPEEEQEKRKAYLFGVFGIGEFAEVKVANLSTGMKQKVSLAISLVHDPDIIIFDEPTNGLDVLTAKVVTDFLLELKKQGKTVIVSTHIFSLIEKICDRVGIVIHGKMVECDSLEAVCHGMPLEDRFFDLFQAIEEKGGDLSSLTVQGQAERSTAEKTEEAQQEETVVTEEPAAARAAGKTDRAVSKMKALFTILKKELARFFGDSRMVFSTILLPGLLIFVMYQFMGDAMTKQFTPEQADRKCYVSNLPETWRDPLKKLGFSLQDVTADEVDSARKQVKDQKKDLVILFPDQFENQVASYDIYSGQKAPDIEIYYNSASTDSSDAYETMCAFLDQQESLIANKFDINAGKKDAKEYDLASEEDTTAKLFSSMLPFLLIIFLYSGCVAVAPESIAGEKERGTITSLLVTPAKRNHIALGKIGALSFIAVLSGASSAIGTVLSMPKLVGGSSKISGANYQLQDYVLLGVVILSTALVLVTLISLISAFAKTVREAGTYVTPLMIVVMLLGVTSMFGDGAKQALGYYAIPLYNSIQSMIGILEFHTNAVHILMTICCNLVVTAIGVSVLAKMFDSEYVMFHK